MPWMKFIGSRMILLLTLTLFLATSCQKDLDSDNVKITDPPTITNPTNKDFTKNKMDHLSPFGNVNSGLVSEKEVREVIQAKELLRALIKESLIQLLFNHDFNPLMPQINTRMACTTCSEPDCGCPFQDTSLDPNINVFPQLLALKYYNSNAADCTCTLATSPNGLQVTGEMRIRFSDNFTTTGHYITLYPQDDFTVDGYDIDADSIRIQQRTINGANDTIVYRLKNLVNIAVSKNGDTTRVNGSGTKSDLKIVDVNNNHGSIENAYGLLDDTFCMTLRSLVIQCSNGESVIANSSEDLIYDTACDNIQDGMVNLTTIPPGGFGFGDLVATYDYGAPATGSDPGICDDSIKVTIPLPSD